MYVSIQYQNGKLIIDQFNRVKSYLELEYPDCVFSDWQSDAPGKERCLVWENEEKADNDDGKNAIAVITKQIDFYE